MKYNLQLFIIILASMFSMVVFAQTNTNHCLANIHSHIISTKTLWLDECNLENKDIPMLTAYLDQNPEITQLYLMNNQIGNEGAILISKTKHLKLVELRNNKIGTKGTLALAKSSIQILDIKGNAFKSLSKQREIISAAKSNGKTILG